MKKIKFKYIIFLVLISYIFTYILSKSSYYEYHLREKTSLTNKQIKKFEEDVKNNKNVDINDYLEYQNYDYSTKLGNITYKSTTILNNGMKKSIIWVFKSISKLTS